MKFTDLHLKPNLKKKERIEKLIHQASELGYNLVGISLTPKIDQNILRFIQEVCKDYGVDFVKRIDLKPNSAGSLLKQLRSVRRKFEVVAVECLSKSVARQAAKDRRVDLLMFTSTNPEKRFFDTAEARLSIQGETALEVDTVLLLKYSGFLRMRLFSYLCRETAIASKFGIPIVVSSGAENNFGLRAPYDVVSFIGLAGIDRSIALNAVSTMPSEIVQRNRRKLGSEYVADGISIFRRGKKSD